MVENGDLWDGKMNKYKCGHKSDTIIMNTTELALAFYFIWIKTTGYDGNKSECFNCYCNRKRKEN
jgi:hypothetical protein